MQPGERAAPEAERYVEAVAREQRLEAPPEGRSATYTFHVPESDTYVIWGRVFSLSEAGNSLWVRVDEGRWRRWNNMGTIGAWSWDEVHDSDRGEAGSCFRLSEGKHTFEVAHRERGVRLDKLLVTSNENYEPQGRTPAPAIQEDAQRIWLEAEEGRLQAPMSVRNAPGAAGWRYIESDEASPREQVPEGGRALYHFEVAEPGEYFVWGRVRAKGDEHDSFWVRVDEGDWVKWNGIEQRPA